MYAGWQSSYNLFKLSVANIRFGSYPYCFQDLLEQCFLLFLGKYFPTYDRIDQTKTELDGTSRCNLKHRNREWILQRVISMRSNGIVFQQMSFMEITL